MKLTIDPAVLHMSLASGDAVLVHSGTANYYSLNETGYRIWSMLAKGLAPDEAALELEREYDVTRSQAVASVDRLVHRLVDEGLARLTVEDQVG